MITSVDIKNLRGIQDGKLEELTPLVVLVGPNGCGKSTVLEGLLMASSPDPGDAIGWTIARRHGVKQGARWLICAVPGVTESVVLVEGGPKSEYSRSCTVQVDKTVAEPATRLHCSFFQKKKLAHGDNNTHFEVDVDFGEGNGYRSKSQRVTFADIDEVHVVEPMDTEFQPLHRLYSKAVTAGRRDSVVDLVSSIVPGLKYVEILTEGNSPIVHLVFADYSVPAALGGDGVYSTLRVALELARRSSGLIMVEEPELHLHPAAICQVARAVWAAVRRGLQIVVTTHSLELIDALASEAKTDEDLVKLSLYRLQLIDGCLRSSRVDGQSVARLRSSIEEDLR